MSQSWLEGLNDEQRRAVAHNFGPLLILAGAGSGKTTVLVARAGRLLEERLVVRSENLCVLTFTNKAARELKARVTNRLGAQAKGIWAGTFHSFGLMLLRRHYKEAGLIKEFGILDPGDGAALVKETLRDFDTAGKTAYDADRVLEMMSRWRESGRTQAQKDDEYEEAVEWLLPRYLKRLTLLGMVDFDGLILRPIELMESNPLLKEAIQGSFQQIMVDEFQDTNQMQMKLIRALTSSHKNLTVVGDDDQSIYGWRGACIRNILDFPKFYDHCEVVRLERNYRSTPAILSVANAVIAKNSQRHAKVLKSAAGAEQGELPEVHVYEDENEEAEHVGLEIQDYLRQGYARKDIAVLYRSNSQGALLEAELRKQQIPYLMSGGTAFFDRKETRDILAFLRCAVKPNEVALRRILNVPPRGIGDKTVEDIAAYCAQYSHSFVAACKNWQLIPLEERAGKHIDEFFSLIDRLNALLTTPGEGTAGEKLLRFLQEIGYRSHLEKHATNALVATNRWKLIEIFTRILDRFFERGGTGIQTLKEFIDAMELRDSIEDKKENEDRVQLLTLHACKGLEFPVVFLMGLEEDILPHKTLGNDLSEERRLFYVGVTRAQKRLILTRARRRRKHGKLVDSAPSRFLLELPKNLLQERQGPRPVREEVRKSMIADLFKKLDALGPSKKEPQPS